MTKHPTLANFDPSKPAKLLAGASSHGLGAVLLRNDHPIAYASKSLTSAQQNYAQIEKRNAHHGCNKFYDYIYRLPTVAIEIDHKPLESILRKPIHAAPAHLQRMILSIQKYALYISHTDQANSFIADTLSRSPLTDLVDDLEYEQYDCNIMHTLSISETKV